MQTARAQATPPAAALAALDNTPSQYLRLGVGGEMYAAAISAVREILEVGQMTALPQTPAFVRGVMNLRGAVVPVIDLAGRFGAPPIRVGRRTCIVVVEVTSDDAAPESEQAARPHVVGLMVDAVYEVFESMGSELESVPPMGTLVAPEYLQAIARVRAEVCAVLHLERLLSQAALAELIASQPTPTTLS